MLDTAMSLVKTERQQFVSRVAEKRRGLRSTSHLPKNEVLHWYVMKGLRSLVTQGGLHDDAMKN